MNNGWFRIHRKLFDHDLWLLEPFTRGQAWIDLVGNANHKEGSFMVRGNLVTVKRGQIGWSEISMAKRWRWSRNKVRRFLKRLETEQQIEQQKSRLTSVITIRNYERYQADEQQTIQQTIQQKDNRRNTNKNDKNEKNITPPPRRFGSIKSVGEAEFQTIASIYQVPVAFVRSKYDDMNNYCQSKGKTYRNYYAALRRWVKEDALKVKQKEAQHAKPNIVYAGDTA